MFKQKNNKLYRIEFNIISRGTEREGNSKGYMAVTFRDNNEGRKIIPISHGIRESQYNENCLEVNEDTSIEKIAFSRFQLIPAIMYWKNKKYFNKKDDILVIGSGSIGFTTCTELARQGHKNIFLLLKKGKKINTNLFKKVYNINLKIIYNINRISHFKYIIDATGNSDVLRAILNKCLPFSNIFILGTPRKRPEINALLIHRKNLILIGSHEITGISNKERNKIFNEVLEENKKNPQHLYEQISQIVNYSKKTHRKILHVKRNIISIMRFSKNE